MVAENGYGPLFLLLIKGNDEGIIKDFSYLEILLHSRGYHS